MNLFIINLLLAVLWVFLWGDLTLYTLGIGLIFGYITLLLFTRIRGHEGPDTLWNAYGRKLWRAIVFVGYFFRLLVVSNLQIAKEILTPGLSIQPRVIRYEVTGLGPFSIVTFANAITLTPGTLVVDVRHNSDGRSFLYIHSLFAEDRQATIRSLDELRERMQEDVFLGHRHEEFEPPQVKMGGAA